MINVTAVHQIEISSECNLRCKYCPHPHLERPKTHMTPEIFSKALSWVTYFNDQGTQGEVALTGMGEAILHPNFDKFVKWLRQVHPGKITLSTNGVALTESHCEAMRENDVLLYVSLHRPEKAAFAVQMGKEYGILADVNASAAINSFDWAGQIDWPVQIKEKSVTCDYLAKGKVVILVDGMISTCCLDAHGKQLIGSVFEDPREAKTQAGELCKSCHMVIPK